MRIPALAVALFTSLITNPGFAVIAAKTPPSSIYAATGSVVVAKVTKVTPQSGIIEASATAIKGTTPSDALKFKVEGLPAAIDGVREGDPIVLFLARRNPAGNALHVNGIWAYPEAAQTKGHFIVRKDKQAELRQSYPGTTPALARLMQELKDNDGKYSMLDKVSPDVLKGGTKVIDPSTLRLPDAAGRTAVGNFGEDPKGRAVLVLKEDGLFRHDADESGNPRGEPDADFTRLTGEPLAPYAGRFKGATAAALDVNADGRTDLLVNSKEGPMLLINRGFGCFFVNADIGKTLGDHFPPTAKWTAADADGDKHDDVVVFGEAGKATAILNPPAK